MLKVDQVIPRFILGAILLVLAVTQTLKQSIHMYKAKKAWQLNRYIERLVKDGILYFLLYVSVSPSLFSICCHPVPLSILLSSTAQKLTTRTDRNALLNITSILEAQDGSILSSTSLQFLTMFYITTFCSIMPRFIISVRELYDRDRHGWQGAGVDTGFGVQQPIASQNAALSAIAFADVAPGQGQAAEGDANESEGIQLEPLGDNTRQV